MPDDHAILVVADSVFVFPIELVNLDLEAIADRAGIEVLLMPAIHLAHVLDHVLGAQLRGPPRRSVYMQRRKSAGKSTERIEVGKIGEMIGVEMADEDVVDEAEDVVESDESTDEVASGDDADTDSDEESS